MTHLYRFWFNEYKFDKWLFFLFVYNRFIAEWIFFAKLKLHNENYKSHNQRWSPRGRPWPRGRPRGHILKSLALVSRPQVLKNWPVLGLRTALFFELLKFCVALEKFFGKCFFCGDRLKNVCEDLFLEIA